MFHYALFPRLKQLSQKAIQYNNLHYFFDCYITFHILIVTFLPGKQNIISLTLHPDRPTQRAQSVIKALHRSCYRD